MELVKKANVFGSEGIVTSWSSSLSHVSGLLHRSVEEEEEREEREREGGGGREWEGGRGGEGGREGRGGREGERESTLLNPKQPRLHHYCTGQKLLTKWQRVWLLILQKRSHATKFLHCLIFPPFYLLHSHPLTFLILTRRMQLSNSIRA